MQQPFLITVVSAYIRRSNLEKYPEFFFENLKLVLPVGESPKFDFGAHIIVYRMYKVLQKCISSPLRCRSYAPMHRQISIHYNITYPSHSS